MVINICETFQCVGQKLDFQIHGKAEFGCTQSNNGVLGGSKKLYHPREGI